MVGVRTLVSKDGKIQVAIPSFLPFPVSFWNFIYCFFVNISCEITGYFRFYIWNTWSRTYIQLEICRWYPQNLFSLTPLKPLIYYPLKNVLKCRFFSCCTYFALISRVFYPLELLLYVNEHNAHNLPYFIDMLQKCSGENTFFALNICRVCVLTNLIAEDNGNEGDQK